MKKIDSLKKTELLKTWLNKDASNRVMIRRIGIPQYQLIDIVSVEELQSIKDEFENIVWSDVNFKILSDIKDSDYMNRVLNRMYSPDFFAGWYGALTRTGEEQDLPEFKSWKHMLENNQDFRINMSGWWKPRDIICRFFKNVRIYLRSKIADNIMKNKGVYTLTSDIWVENITSKFISNWSNSRRMIPRQTAIFFVEKDYANRYVFMSGNNYFAITLTNIPRVAELK